MRTPSTLVVVSGKTILQSCALYKNHWCAIVNDHHICPKSWFEKAGVLVDTPMIKLCPSCHANVHAAIDGRIRDYDESLLPRRCRILAAQAFDIASDLRLTPGLTL